MINQWDIWFAEFPFDDSSGSKDRPVIVLSVEPLEVLSVKVTSHEVRNKDSYDISIVNWKKAGLKQPSIARISKTVSLSQNRFRRKLGALCLEDRQSIMEKYIQFIENNN